MRKCAPGVHIHQHFPQKGSASPKKKPARNVNNYVVAIQWMYALEKAATIPTTVIANQPSPRCHCEEHSEAILSN